jgi:hypothetical protein
VVDLEESAPSGVVRPRRPSSQTWRTFLRNHLGQIVAADFFVVPTVTYRLVFVLVLFAHDRRRIRHVAVTAHPTSAWTAQRLRDAFPWDEAPRYLIHDHDHAFDSLRATAMAMTIEEVLTAPRAPWENSFVERFIGSARRECFNHVIVFNEAGLKRLMTLYRWLDHRPPIPRIRSDGVSGRHSGIIVRSFTTSPRCDHGIPTRDAARQRRWSAAHATMIVLSAEAFQ